MSQIMYNYPAMLAHAGEMSGYAGALAAVGADIASEQAALAGAWQGDTGMTYQAWQALRAAGGGQGADARLGQCQLGAARGNAHVAAQRDLQPAAHRDTVDSSDDRLLELLDGAEQLVRGFLLQVVVGLRHHVAGTFLDVGACAKGAVAGAGDDHAAHRVVIARALEDGVRARVT